MIDLGTLGGEFSWARAVSSREQVVGERITTHGESHTFSWTQAGGMIDLGSFGAGHSYAAAVNASGQVVGVPSELLLGSLVKAYRLVGFSPARDFDYIEINRVLRLHSHVVQETVRTIGASGGSVHI